MVVCTVCMFAKQRQPFIYRILAVRVEFRVRETRLGSGGKQLTGNVLEHEHLFPAVCQGQVFQCVQMLSELLVFCAAFERCLIVNDVLLFQARRSPGEASVHSQCPVSPIYLEKPVICRD